MSYFSISDGFQHPFDHPVCLSKDVVKLHLSIDAHEDDLVEKSANEKMAAEFVFLDAVRNHEGDMTVYMSSLLQNIVEKRTRGMSMLGGKTSKYWASLRELLRRCGTRCTGLCCTQGDYGALSLYVRGSVTKNTRLIIDENLSALTREEVTQKFELFLTTLATASSAEELALPLWSMLSNDAESFITFVRTPGRSLRGRGDEDARTKVVVPDNVAINMWHGLSTAVRFVGQKVSCEDWRSIVKLCDDKFLLGKEIVVYFDENSSAKNSGDNNTAFAHNIRALDANAKKISLVPTTASDSCTDVPHVFWANCMQYEIRIGSLPSPLGSYTLHEFGVEGNIEARFDESIETHVQRINATQDLWLNRNGGAHKADHMAAMKLRALYSSITSDLCTYIANKSSWSNVAHPMDETADIPVFIQDLRNMYDCAKLVIGGNLGRGFITDVNWCSADFLASDRVLAYVKRRCATLSADECAERVSMTAVLHNVAHTLCAQIFGFVPPESCALNEHDSAVDEGEIVDILLSLAEKNIGGLWATDFSNEVPVPLTIVALIANLLQLRTLEQITPVQKFADANTKITQTFANFEKAAATACGITADLNFDSYGNSHSPCCLVYEMFLQGRLFHRSPTVLDYCTTNDEVGRMTSLQTLYVKPRIERLIALGLLPEESAAEALQKARPCTLDAVAVMLTEKNLQWVSASEVLNVQSNSPFPFMLDCKFAHEDGYGNGVMLTIAAEIIEQYAAHSAAMFQFNSDGNTLDLRPHKNKEVAQSECEACVVQGFSDNRTRCRLWKVHNKVAVLALAFYFQRGATTPFLVAPNLLAALAGHRSLYTFDAWRMATNINVARSFVALHDSEESDVSIYDQCTNTAHLTFAYKYARSLKAMQACTSPDLFQPFFDRLHFLPPVAMLSARVNTMSPRNVCHVLAATKDGGCFRDDILLYRAVFMSMLVFDRNDMDAGEHDRVATDMLQSIRLYVVEVGWDSIADRMLHVAQHDSARDLSLLFSEEWKSAMAERARAMRREARSCGDRVPQMDESQVRLVDAFQGLSSLAARQRNIYHILEYVAGATVDQVDEMYELLTGESRLPVLALLRARPIRDKILEAYGCICDSLQKATRLYAGQDKAAYKDFWAPRIVLYSEPLRAHREFAKEARALLHHAIHIKTRDSVYPIVDKLQRPSRISTCGRNWTISPWVTKDQFNADFELLRASKGVFLAQ